MFIKWASQNLIKIKEQMNKQKIISIIKSSISLVNNFDTTKPLQLQCENHCLLQNLKVTQKDFNLYPTFNKKAIGIRNIFQNPNLRLTVYYLQKGTVMKLHDHNEMRVVSKVLSGKIQAKLYKLLDQTKNIYKKSIKVYDSDGVYYIDGNREENLHQLKALEATFFLDIIFPDYDQDNDCNFYKEKAVLSQKQVVLQKVQCDDIVFQEI